MIARALAAVLAAAVAVLGIHLVLLVAAVTIAAVVVVLGWAVAERVARTGWRADPYGSRYAA